MDAILVLLGVGAFLFAILLLLSLAAFLMYPTIHREYTIRQRAKRDYEAARGTQHRKIIQRSISVLQRRIAEKEAQIESLKAKLITLQQEETSELDKVLAEYLLTERLPIEVSGIGKKKASQIHTYVYRSSLKDLHRSERISGIGPKRQAALSQWVRAIERQWPALRDDDYPQKSAIQARYRDKHAALIKQMNILHGQLQPMQVLSQRAHHALDPLRAVSSADFREALKENGEAAQKLEPYLIGVFAEWEEVPEWFRELITEYR